MNISAQLRGNGKKEFFISMSFSKSFSFDLKVFSKYKIDYLCILLSKLQYEIFIFQINVLLILENAFLNERED